MCSHYLILLNKPTFRDSARILSQWLCCLWVPDKFDFQERLLIRSLGRTRDSAVSNIPKLKRLHAACTCFCNEQFRCILTHHLKRWRSSIFLVKVNALNKEIITKHSFGKCIFIFSPCICYIGGPHWSNSQLWESQLLQGVYPGLLFWGEAASSFWIARRLQ